MSGTLSMAGDSTDMDSLFEGMDFVMPLEIENDVGPVSQTKPSKERKMERDGRTLRAPESTTVSIPPIISPSVDPITPLSHDAVGLQFRSSIALPSTLTRSPFESLNPTPTSLSSHLLNRDPSTPLDESLFSGLNILSFGNDTATDSKQRPASDIQTNIKTGNAIETPVSSTVHERSRSFDGAEKMGNSDRDEASIEGITAAFNGVFPISPSVKYSSSGIPPTVKVSSGSALLGVKPSMRRKRRSMKIGYGREEEENEELLLRKTAIREALGGAQVREDFVSASTSSTPGRELSRESSQGGLDVEESTFGATFQDSEVLNGHLQVKVNINSSEVLSSRTSLPQYSTLDVHSIERVASREIPVEEVLQEPEPESTVPNIAGDEANISVSEEPMNSLVTAASPQSDVAAEQSNANLTRLNSDTGLSVTKDADGQGAESTVVKEVDLDKTVELDKAFVLDVQLLAKQREGSLEERLDYAKDIIVQKMKLLQGKSSAVSALRKAAVHKRRKAAEKVADASVKCKDLETELEVACEKEDFDRADTLAGSISEAEKKLTLATEAFKLAEAESDSTSLTLQEVLNLQVIVEEEGAKIFELLKQEAEDSANKVFLEAQETANLEMGRVMEREKAVELRKMDLDVDFKQVKDAHAELNRAIEDLTSPEFKEKLVLLEKRSQFEDELDDLKAQVRTKEADIAECNRLIAQVEKKMGGVLVTFEKEKTGLDLRLEALVSSARKLEEDSNLLIAEKQGIAQTVANADRERVRLQNVAAVAGDVGVSMKFSLEKKKAAALTTAQSREKRSDLVLQEKHAQAAAALLRKEALSTRALIQDLTSAKVKLSQELGAAKDRINFVEKRGPELDIEKKQAAAARNFKVAGRLAAEAKVISGEKDSASADLARIVLELQKIEAEAEVKLSALADLDNLLTTKDREAAMARCERLRLVSAGEIDITLELKEFEEVTILELEAEAADAEFDEIQRLCQFDEREYRNYVDSMVRETTADFSEKQTAKVESEMLVAASTRAERDAIVELERLKNPEILDSQGTEFTN